MPITSPSARAKTSSIVLPSWDGSTLLTLRVTGTGNAGKYSLDDGVLKAQTNVTASVNILTGIPNKTVSFEYNAQGLRTKKTVRMLGKMTETEYILHGKLVTELVVRKYDESDPTNITQTDTLHFFYDAQSRPAKVEYNGEMYTYLHNLQGDIVGIIDGNGEVVVQYTYDAWGEPVSTVSTLITDLSRLNPFRYRSYTCDEESGSYYLLSRYYNPTWMRFVNIDSIIGKVGTLISYTGYVYSRNNAINYVDDSGHSPVSIKKTEGRISFSSIFSKIDSILNDISTFIHTIKIPDATLSLGFNVNASPSFWSFNGQIAATLDIHGNIAIQWTKVGGLATGTPSASVGIFGMITNAPSAKHLEGEGMQIGGSVGAGSPFAFVSGGGEINVFPSDEAKTYTGFSAGANAGIGTPGMEYHTEWGETKTIGSFNLFDAITAIWDGLWDILIPSAY